jgi:hypothetical protein
VKETKTGAVICKRPDQINQVTYEPLAFVTEVPGDFSDEDLKQNLDMFSLIEVIKNCEDILFRADIHSTSNEVQEVFDNLHLPDDVPSIPFTQKTVPL